MFSLEKGSSHHDECLKTENTVNLEEHEKGASNKIIIQGKRT